MTPVGMGSRDLDFDSAQALLKRHLSDEQWQALRLYKNDIAPDDSDHATPQPGQMDDLEAEWLLPRGCVFQVETAAVACPDTKLRCARVSVDRHSA